ncbi:hypothetical protein RFI_39147 [Reticulomyxa filosa]|uniref:TLDc domain-containing protein n=1 Tax=Reticulomyxa filosa TaxID=46433 RepID=X6L8Q1_RETFI|nr:hypothetical protein RFI_39147 [Reticulomyxa filosa]|eukprot:ETN98362.1 hypothetical protein RFI_39147 [Reticulomyxa filosa]
MCKEAQIGWMSREDIIRALRKSPESQVYKESEIKQRPKSATSQVIILHTTQHDRITQIYEGYKEVSKMVGQIENQLIDLEESSRTSKRKVSDTCKQLMSAVEAHEKSMLEKIDIYKNKKKRKLLQVLSELQKMEGRFKKKNEQIAQCINDSELDVNQKTEQLKDLLKDDPSLVTTTSFSTSNADVLSFGTPVAVQFVDDEKDTPQLVAMVDNLLKQHMVVIEAGTIVLSDIAFKKTTLPQMLLGSAKYSVDKFNKLWKDECTYHLEIAALPGNRNTNENSSSSSNDSNMPLQWTIIKEMAMDLDKPNGVIEFADEKDNYNYDDSDNDNDNDKSNGNNNRRQKRVPLEWEKEYKLRMRICCCPGIAFTSFSNAPVLRVVEDLSFSKILKNTTEVDTLMSFLPRGKSSTLSLLYRASHDGFAAKQFHDKCNAKGPTLTVLLSEDYNHVFGGYISVSWTGTNTWKSDTNAFLYLIRSGKGDNPQKKKREKRGDDTVGIYSLFFFLFVCVAIFLHVATGGGHDMYIVDMPNSNTGSYCGSYSFNIPADTTRLAGATNFRLKEIEVFLVE